VSLPGALRRLGGWLASLRHWRLAEADDPISLMFRHPEEDPPPPFTMMPLGPFNAEDGRWCCGLRCTGREPGVPCPYGLKIRPSEER
jgi:hypothetical protein